MKIIVLSLLVLSIQSYKGAVSIILQKSLYIPQGGYSVLNISNNINQLTNNVMSGELQFNLNRVIRCCYAEKPVHKHEVRCFLL